MDRPSLGPARRLKGVLQHYRLGTADMDLTQQNAGWEEGFLPDAAEVARPQQLWPARRLEVSGVAALR